MGNRIGTLSSLKKKKKAKESPSFLVNGGLLLEELIKSSNGRYRYPIRNFSVKDLLKATNNFDERNSINKDGLYEMYKGSLEGRLIVVKKFKNEKDIYLAIRDIAIKVQMCRHKNVLKLGGCCLEDEAIAIVHEHIEGRFLDDCIKDGVLGHDNRSSLSWKCRLRAANEIASVVAYLHTALDRPVVNRNIKPRIFMIDQHGVVKLFDFSFSISIPLGESGVEDTLMGTFGFLDPEYIQSSFVTEKSDVYSFGVLLLMLLTGQSASNVKLSKNEIFRVFKMQRYFQNDDNKTSKESKNDVFLVSKMQRYFQNDDNKINEIVDPNILRGGTDEQELQFHAFAALALRCTQERGDDRPDMIGVAKELRRIERSIPLQLPPP